MSVKFSDKQKVATILNTKHLAFTFSSYELLNFSKTNKTLFTLALHIQPHPLLLKGSFLLNTEENGNTRSRITVALGTLLSDTKYSKWYF